MFGRLGFLSCVAVAALLVVGAGCGETAEDAVARVNGQLLPRAELEQRTRSLAVENFGDVDWSSITEDVRGELRSSVLESMIGQALMVEAAQSAGGKISDDEVELEMSFARARFPSRSDFERELQRRGITEEDFRTNLRKQLLIDKYVEQTVYADVVVTEQEVRARFESNRSEFEREDRVTFRQVVIPVVNDASIESRADSRRSAESVRERIVAAPQDFAQVAQAKSGDESAANGGLLGPVPRSAVIPGLLGGIDGLAIGEVSPVLESRFGYHIVRVEAREEGRDLTFADAEEVIRQQILELRRQQLRREWVSGLRTGARVEILDPALAGGASG